MPRDGRFIEKLGTYNPLLPKDDEKRVVMNTERVKHWLGLGAKPTDRIQRMLEADGTLPKTARNNPKKAIAGKAAQERLKEKSDKIESLEIAVEPETPAEAAVEPETPVETPAEPETPVEAAVEPETPVETPAEAVIEEVVSEAKAEK
jgi:small subunit ribosomal protein S16